VTAIQAGRPAEPPVEERRPRRAGALSVALGACLLFALVTPWVLRPWFMTRDDLPRYPGGSAASFEADLYLNVWILGWTAHAVLTDPSRIFDGNIFYPARNMIAGSENMLAHLPVTVPALAATGNALVVLKAMALESFVLAGLAMFLLVYHHTRNATAALVAGAAFTFAPWRANAIPQPQYLGTQYLPFALLAVDCWLERRRARALVGLALAMAFQGLACVYLGYFAFVVVPVYALARVALSAEPRRLQALGAIAAAIGAGAAVLVPVMLPYLRGRQQLAIPEQNLEMISAFSWQPHIFVMPATIASFIGAVPVVVVALAVLSRVARWRPGVSIRRPPVAATWVLLAVAFVLAAGPYVGLPGGVRLPTPYLALYHLVPGFSGMRAPARFFIVVTTALCALAGYELARATAGTSPRARRALGLGLFLAVALLATPRPPVPVAARLGGRAPEIYRWLAERPAHEPVLEVPGRVAPNDILGQVVESRSMVASTIHWHPLLGGYTAYTPPSAAFITAIVQRLPDPEALQLLVNVVDLRWIVVHGTSLPLSTLTRWQGFAGQGIELIRRFQSDELYEVTQKPTRRWRDQVLPRAAAPAPDTFEGTSTAPLSSECRQARILAVMAPKSMLPAPVPVPVPVRFQNTSPCPWPAVGVRREGLVGLGYKWTSPGGRVHPSEAFSRFLHDVKPGEVMESPALIFPGGELGTWRLEVQLKQYGQPEPLATMTTDVDMVKWNPPPPPLPPPPPPQ
jgi:hypothetical protein